MHGGSSLGHVREPNSLFSAKFHFYGERTLYDELSDVDRRIYYGDVPQSLALSHQFRHLGHYRRFAHFAEDVAAGELPASSSQAISARRRTTSTRRMTCCAAMR